MTSKHKVIMTSIIGVISLLAIIILTNDAFDDLRYRDSILISIVILQLCVAIYNTFTRTNKQ